MARVRRGFKARRRRNKIFKLAKGFHFDRRTKWRQTVQTVVRALHYSFIGRKLLKRDMRRLWITRINAGAHTLGLSYSKLMGDLKKKDVQINRKMLADIVARDMKGFEAIVAVAK
ncbi:MAG: 50S ribosomal protein L20 [Halobacteriovoraceae bacterium]|jgi:large subunit ribosomal protein L20|nr:50S ribosomal protein L20 [Halobacteriovoraceae bacterium]MBT5095305.1 50S ribosomal protein L20 [Halobacteriovoraceae bacterium]